ncbi:MAG: hypothetical protein ACPL4H_01990 [Anaerolineales bacterium]
MSKKSKKQTRSTPAVVKSTPSPLGSVQTPKPVEKGFNPDYTPVIKDLKRIGTLAGTFFLIMIILSFFIK